MPTYFLSHPLLVLYISIRYILSNTDCIADNSTNWDKIWHKIKDVDIIHLSKDIDDTDHANILKKRRNIIKSSFLHSWNGYATYALGHDEVYPLSKLPNDQWGGLGATLIDSLDTMISMNLNEDQFIKYDIFNILQSINFDKNIEVSFFETIIRHLGGLIGSYEISKLMLNDNNLSNLLLNKAINLSNNLLYAFNTTHGIPKSIINLQTKTIKNFPYHVHMSVLSEIATNSLEFYVISKYTKNYQYYKKSKNIYNLLNDIQKNGIFYTLIDPKSAQFANREYRLGGMSDSFYEYTLKIWILTGYTDKLSIKLYIEAINALNENLLRIIYDTNRRNKSYLFYGKMHRKTFYGKMEQLQCFLPGILALGSYHATLREKHSKKYNIPLTDYEQQLILKKEEHLKLSHFLVESCYSLFIEMPIGLAPESILFNDNGWIPHQKQYELRPETLESLFILYCITNNEIYRDWSWNIFKSIEKYCKTDIAFSGIKDVTQIPPVQNDKMESYVMAETFKYLYLMFDKDTSSLLSLNKFVFNTEAHPMKIFNLQKQEWFKDYQQTQCN